MSFCCGASMMGTKGTLKHFQTQIHNVPLLFCPVCYRVEVHHVVENEYEILAEYAHGDGADEVDFRDYVYEDEEELFENCVNAEHEDPMDVVRTQIDTALDLLSFAKQLEDTTWQMQLKKRLAVMSHRQQRLLQKNKS